MTKKPVADRLFLGRTMQISVNRAHFKLPSEAGREIAEEGLYVCEMNVPPVDNQSHWHDFSTLIYILEGELHITDSERGEVLIAGPGDRVSVPERVLHSERSTRGYRIIAGMTADPASLTGEVDLDPALLEDE